MTARVKRKDITTFVIFFVLVVAFTFGALMALGQSSLPKFKNLKELTASVFFINSVTTEGLKASYASAERGRGDIGILIVPGHDDYYSGTSFGSLREADLTRDLGGYIAETFSKETGFKVHVLRNKQGFLPEFTEYLGEHRASIEKFVRSKKEIMANLVGQGLVHEVAWITHNSLNFDRAIKLYAINEWANRQGIDLVIHVHFNDYPGRKKNKVGKFNGYSVYVPESQFSNARASITFGHALSRRLKEFAPQSSMPKESAGVVEDQELIAIGAFNTLDGVGALVEYWYIYEPQFNDTKVREQVLRELAHKTYLGVKDYFGATPKDVKYSTLFLPYHFNETLSKRTGFNPAVLSLQSALVLQKLYPPEGLTKNECPMTGYLGPCTELALSLFQKTHEIKNEGGVVGPETREVLRNLFGE